MLRNSSEKNFSEFLKEIKFEKSKNLGQGPQTTLIFLPTFPQKNPSFPQAHLSFPQVFTPIGTQCTDGHEDRLIPNMGSDHPISKPFSEPFPGRFSEPFSEPNYISRDISENLYLRYVLLYFISVMIPLIISGFNPFTFTL